MDAVQSNITVRSIDLSLENGAAGPWNPRLPEVSHTLNAFQLALPYLEPYFIDAVREGASMVDDAAVRADVGAFCGQEANHARQHARYNRSLRRRYPRIETFEREIQQWVTRSRREAPLAQRLAFTVGCEAITGELSRLLIRRADRWFRAADGSFAALMVWHAVEEIEHRSVAAAVCRLVGVPQRVRLRGLLSAVDRMIFAPDPVTTYLLEFDGIRGHRSRARRLALRADLVAAIVPRLARMLAPRYDPAHDPAPPFVERWTRAFERGAPLPFVDDAPQATGTGGLGGARYLRPDGDASRARSDTQDLPAGGVVPGSEACARRGGLGRARDGG
jgi:predicted metal-dependent hydrolase